MLLTKKVFNRIKNSKLQTRKKCKKRKNGKKKRRRRRKKNGRGRSFRKRRKALNLRKKTLKFNYMKGGGFQSRRDNPYRWITINFINNSNYEITFKEPDNLKNNNIPYLYILLKLLKATINDNVNAVKNELISDTNDYTSAINDILRDINLLTTEGEGETTIIEFRRKGEAKQHESPAENIDRQIKSIYDELIRAYAMGLSIREGSQTPQPRTPDSTPPGSPRLTSQSSSRSTPQSSSRSQPKVPLLNIPVGPQNRPENKTPERKLTQEQVALKLQKRFRGKQARKKAEKLRIQQEAATKIQQEAATKIQQEAETKIQQAFRMRQGEHKAQTQFIFKPTYLIEQTNTIRDNGELATTYKVIDNGMVAYGDNNTVQFRVQRFPNAYIIARKDPNQNYYKSGPQPSNVDNNTIVYYGPFENKGEAERKLDPIEKEEENRQGSIEDEPQPRFKPTILIKQTNKTNDEGVTTDYEVINEGMVKHIQNDIVHFQDGTFVISARKVPNTDYYKSEPNSNNNITLYYYGPFVSQDEASNKINEIIQMNPVEQGNVEGTGEPSKAHTPSGPIPEGKVGDDGQPVPARNVSEEEARRIAAELKEQEARRREAELKEQEDARREDQLREQARRAAELRKQEDVQGAKKDDPTPREYEYVPKYLIKQTERTITKGNRSEKVSSYEVIIGNIHIVDDDLVLYQDINTPVNIIEMRPNELITGQGSTRYYKSDGDQKGGNTEYIIGYFDDSIEGLQEANDMKKFLEQVGPEIEDIKARLQRLRENDDPIQEEQVTEQPSGEQTRMEPGQGASKKTPEEPESITAGLRHNHQLPSVEPQNIGSDQHVKSRTIFWNGQPETQQSVHPSENNHVWNLLIQLWTI